MKPNTWKSITNTNCNFFCLVVICIGFIIVINMTVGFIPSAPQMIKTNVSAKKHHLPSRSSTNTKPPLIKNLKITDPEFKLLKPSAPQIVKTKVSTKISPLPSRSSSNMMPYLTENVKLTYPEFGLPKPIIFTLHSLKGWTREMRQIPGTKATGNKVVFNDKRYIEGYIHHVKNGQWKGTDCGWPNEHSLFTKKYNNEQSLVTSASAKTVYVALAPQSWSVQHFIDGALPKISIIYDELMANPNAKLLVLPKTSGYEMVYELLDRMGITENKRIEWSGTTAIYAENMIFACKVPPLHPQLWQNAVKLFNLPPPSRKEERTKILYMTRNPDKTGTLSAMPRNGGRQVINEQQMLSAVEKIVDEFNGLDIPGYSKFELITFRHSDYESLDEQFELFSKTVIMFGPHGGAFYNLHYLPTDGLSSVIEFRAKYVIFYQLATMLNQRYYYIQPEQTQGTNMRINIDEFSLVIKDALYHAIK